MFGEDLLVAPVLEPDLTAWPVYLPGPETWVSCNKNIIYVGRTHRLSDDNYEI